MKTLSATVAALISVSSLAFAAEEVKTTTTTNTVGTISEFSPDTIVVRSETAPEPIRYTYTKTTTYVDETGAPVSMETVKSGLPVTVYYVKEGDRMVANRVVVRRAKVKTIDGDHVLEKKPVEGSQVIEKKSTTTTTTESK